ncbi:13706_t:CDS:2 [Cetraspora pellucida]|uniref:13706_t:CDS:1 n=1 Tax=Cetraspora pellucida TaxID=1433469 RepID=A0ACA9NZ56_9GLOM|nr:13706_t:CDS:2 [Cetraspora pellucida]
MTENEVLGILNQTNIKTFKERLEKERLNKDKLLFDNLDFSEVYTITRENLENFSDIKDNNKDLLLETDEILKNLDKQTSQILEQDNYN